MKEYHKINSIFKRDEKTKRFIIGEYADPEFEYLKDNKWIFTEKVDGTNIRVHWTGESVVFGGRSDNAQIPVYLLYKLQELFEGTPRKTLLKTIFPEGEATLYGEGYGAKIQKAGVNYIPTGVDFVLFDAFIGGMWLQRQDIDDIASKLGIKSVPVIGEGTLDDGIAMVKSNPKSTWGDFQSEGIVARPSVELLNRRGRRVITKIKCVDFSHPPQQPIIG